MTGGLPGGGWRKGASCYGAPSGLRSRKRPTLNFIYSPANIISRQTWTKTNPLPHVATSCLSRRAHSAFQLDLLMSKWLNGISASPCVRGKSVPFEVTVGAIGRRERPAVAAQIQPAQHMDKGPKPAQF